jgi:hypothetical protein
MKRKEQCVHGIWKRNKCRLHAYLKAGTRRLIRKKKKENTAVGAGGIEEKREDGEDE